MCDQSPADGTRGQAFTLEAVIAATVILGSLLFALQVSGVTALTASTSSQQVLTQQEAAAAGVVDTATEEGTLRPTLLYWDDDATPPRFHDIPGSVDRPFYTVAPPTAFGDLLTRTFADRNLAFNVNLRYSTTTGSLKRTRLVRQGRPSDDAVRVTRTVTLYDDDRLLYANGTESTTTVTNASFYAPDRYPGGPVYNVIRVEVVVWRI